MLLLADVFFTEEDSRGDLEVDVLLLADVFFTEEDSRGELEEVEVLLLTDVVLTSAVERGEVVDVLLLCAFAEKAKQNIMATTKNIVFFILLLPVIYHRYIGFVSV